MPIAPIPLADNSNPGRDFRDGSGRLVNCYVEPRSKEGRWPAPVYAVDGLSTFAELPVQTQTEDEGLILLEDGTGFLTDEDGNEFALEGDPFDGQRQDPDLGVQKIIADNGYLWVVTGRGVYRVDQGGAATFIGGIAGSKVVTADVNRVNQIGIVSDGRYYVCDTILNTLIDYTDQLLISGPNSVCHYNGYMVVTNSNNIYQISAVNDATSWSSVDVETAIFRGDLTKRCLTRGGDLLIFGTRSIEFWQDVGATNGFVFNRVSAIETGIGPPLSAINLDEAVLFIDNDSSVRIIQNYQTQVISTHYVSRKIREASDWASIRATSYERDGHFFYSISCSDFTLTYNVATQLWHEEKSYGLNRRVINTVEKLDNTYYAGDYAEGKLYTLKREHYSDGAEKPIVMEVITPPVHDFPNRLRVRSLFIDALFGTAAASDTDADESDPKVMVWISEDDGENFIFLEELSLGDINSKYEELRVQGVGTSDQNGFVFKLSSSTPVLRGIMGMSADITPVRA